MNLKTEPRIQASCAFLVGITEEVTVTVKSGLNRGMTQLPLDILDVLTFFYPQSNIAVTQTVKRYHS